MLANPIATRVTLPALPSDARRVYLVFNPTRARLIQGSRGLQAMASFHNGAVEWAPGITWAEREGAFGGRPPAGFPHVLALDLEPEALASPRSLDVLSDLERPELARCVVQLSEDALIVQSEGDSGCLDTTNLVEQLLPAPAGTLVTDVDQYMLEVEQAIGLLPDDERRKASWFFFDLDRNTEEKLRARHLISGSPLIAAVDGVHSALLDCMRNRVQERKSPPGACVPGYNPFGPELRRVTDLFFDLLSQRLFAGGALVPSDVEEAFEAFARGALRLETASGFWSTQPSSGWYFLFAELALLGGQETGPALALTAAQRAQWRDLANGLVRTQEIFTRAYDPRNRTSQPCAPPENLDHLKPEDYCGCSLNSAAVTDEDIRLIAAEYALIPFDDLAAQAALNAETAFPGWAAEIKPCGAP